MTQTQKKPTNPKKTQSEPPSSSSSSSSSRSGMKLIVPLQAVVQGRNGFLLGSLIPLSLFYFLQLYLKRRRPENNSNNPSSPTTLLLPRSSSRSNLSSRGSISRVRVSKLANVVAKRDDSLYYVGIERVEKDPYHVKFNPNGIIQLGLSDNKVIFFVLFLLFNDCFRILQCLCCFWLKKMLPLLFPPCEFLRVSRASYLDFNIRNVSKCFWRWRFLRCVYDSMDFIILTV